MRGTVLIVVAAVASAFAGCVSTPESRLRSEVFNDVYWTAAKECEGRYRTLHVDRIAADGGLSLSADAESRHEAGPFRDCYRKAVTERAERRRSAGLSMPEDFNMAPGVDID